MEIALQTAIYNLLGGSQLTTEDGSTITNEAGDRIIASTAIGVNVYDEPPDVPAGLPDTDFPYVGIGDVTTVSNNTDTTRGGSMTVTLHVWSRSKSSLEVKQILANIQDALDLSPYIIPKFTKPVMALEYTDVSRESNGAFRHGVARYRVNMERL
jgi:hypothetical protein